MNSIFVEDATKAATLRLPDNCTGRLCYAQRTDPDGARVFGHFIVEAQVLADAIWQQIDSPLLEEPGPDDFALHRWLLNPERVDDQPEMLPAIQGELDQTIGELFAKGRARAFCLCCNRNIARHEVRIAGSHRFEARRVNRHLCPEGHLLLGVEEGVVFTGANRNAA